MLAVVGAGIGGLAAAIAARRAGLEVRIYERSPELREIGAGMTLWPNAVHVLDELGVLADVARDSSVFEESVVGDFKGRTWTRIPMGDVGRRLGYPTRLIARAALHKILADRARTELGAEAINTDCQFVGLRQDAGGVTLVLSGGAEVRCDALIGADGVASRVRRELFGVCAVRFHGRTSFRGLCAGYELPAGTPDFVERHGPEGRFAFYRAGERSVAWYANVLWQLPENTDHSRLLEQVFGTWTLPVPSIISASSSTPVHVTPISDIDPLAAWTVGRVTLLGDAAHPMTPDLGQGAAQALEDASTLGRALAGRSIPDALKHYEAERRGRAAGIVLASRKTGRIANLGGHTGLMLRRALWSLLPPRTAVARMAEIVGGPDARYVRAPGS